MKDLIRFINGWLALGWAAIVGTEMYKLGHLQPPGGLAGMLALLIICVALFFIGLYNFVSIGEE